jgi:UDP-N-acetylglucosamine:LPS N-acetylglucosamine transferase
VVQDADMANVLLPTITSLFDHPEQLHTMSAAMKSLANPQAAKYIATLLENLGEQHNHNSEGGPA